MIKTILWDLDNTLLDFDIAERNAIKSLFEKYNLVPCTDSMLKEYDKINKAYWKKFEKDEIDKKLGKALQVVICHVSTRAVRLQKHHPRILL